MATRKDITQGTSAEWLVDAVLRGIIGAARLLPYKVRVPAFAKANRHLISPLAGYRRRALENLALIWPDKPLQQRQKIANACVENAGRVLIENYSNPAFMQHAASFEPTGHGVETLAQAKAAGRPVLLATGHFGNYEAARAALIARGYPLGGLYRDMANPYFNAHYVRTMEAMGQPVFATGRTGMKGLIRHFSGGGMLVMLTDVHIPKAPYLPFMGHLARTATSAAELALRYEAALIPVYATRINGGLDYRVELEAELPHSDPETMTRALSASLEARIKANPEQWFWTHRRWKGSRSKAPIEGDS